MKECSKGPKLARTSIALEAQATKILSRKSSSSSQPHKRQIPPISTAPIRVKQAEESPATFQNGRIISQPSTCPKPRHRSCTHKRPGATTPTSTHRTSRRCRNDRFRHSTSGKHQTYPALSPRPPQQNSTNILQASHSRRPTNRYPLAPTNRPNRSPNTHNHHPSTAIRPLPPHSAHTHPGIIAQLTAPDCASAHATHSTR